MPQILWTFSNQATRSSSGVFNMKFACYPQKLLPLFHAVFMKMRRWWVVPLLFNWISYNYYSRECIIHKTVCNYNRRTLVLSTLPVPLSICSTYLHVSTSPYLRSIVFSLPPSCSFPSPSFHTRNRPRGHSQQQAGLRECKAIISRNMHHSPRASCQGEIQAAASANIHVNHTHKSWHCSSPYYSA